MADDVDIVTEQLAILNRSAIEAALASRPKMLSTGFCSVCDDAIEPERLAANKFAEQCCHCAAELDAERKRKKRLGIR